MPKMPGAPRPIWAASVPGRDDLSRPGISTADGVEFISSGELIGSSGLIFNRAVPHAVSSSYFADASATDFVTHSPFFKILPAIASQFMNKAEDLEEEIAFAAHAPSHPGLIPSGGT